MTILPCTPDSVVSSTGEVKDWSVTTLRTVEVSEIKQLIKTPKKLCITKEHVSNITINNYDIM